MLMQIACMAWAMLLSTDPRQRGLRVLLALSFRCVDGGAVSD